MEIAPVLNIEIDFHVNTEYKRGHLLGRSSINLQTWDIWKELKNELFENEKSISTALELCQELAVEYFSSQITEHAFEASGGTKRNWEISQLQSFCPKYFFEKPLKLFIAKQMPNPSNPSGEKLRSKYAVQTEMLQYLQSECPFVSNDDAKMTSVKLINNYFGCLIRQYLTASFPEKILSIMNNDGQDVVIPLRVMPYQIGDLKGEGRYGNVYEGRDLYTEENSEIFPPAGFFAVKILKLIRIDTKADLNRVVQELECNIRVPDHPNVLHATGIRIIPFANFTKKFLNFIIIIKMEMGEISLYKWLEKHKDNPKSQLQLLTDEVVCHVAYGLHCLHKHGIVHGDLHYGNVLVYKEDPILIKIIDFDQGKSVMEPAVGFVEQVHRSTSSTSSAFKISKKSTNSERSKTSEGDIECFAGLISDIYFILGLAMPDKFNRFESKVENQEITTMDDIFLHLNIPNSVRPVYDCPKYADMILCCSEFVPNLRTVEIQCRIKKHFDLCDSSFSFDYFNLEKILQNYFDHVKNCVDLAKQNLELFNSEKDFSENLVFVSLEKAKLYRSLAKSVYWPCHTLQGLKMEVSDESIRLFVNAICKITSFTHRYNKMSP